ncbi:MAG: PUA domain-containing protein [Halobacteriales archaeon]
MSGRHPSEGDTATHDDLPGLRTVADYQFGAGTGTVLFPPDEPLSIERSRSGRPRQVIAQAGRIVSFTTDGRFTLGIEGGRRLHADRPEGCRVAVTAESEPYVRDGRNAFAKFVLAVDPAVRPDDEVRVTSETGELLGVGRAALSAAGMADFETGMAVDVRDGAGEAGTAGEDEPAGEEDPGGDES